MNFNAFIWDIYKESSKGTMLINYFSQYCKNIENKANIEIYQEIINSLQYKKTEVDDEAIIEYFDNMAGFISDISEELIANNIKTKVDDFEDFEKIFEFFINLETSESDIDNDETELIFGVNDIPFLSECLYFMYPEYCFPYYFEHLYHIVVAIFNEFGIFLPSSPKKNDMYKRMMHYVELCRSLYSFRMKYGINKYELPAFLYGFAVEMIRKYEIEDVLPEPRKAYFIGGGKSDNTIDVSGDFVYLDNVDKTSVTFWNGNPETQPGDIIVMYCLAPRSYIHSIWRAVTPGSYDPFFYFYKTVYIGQPILVKPISLDEMKNDEVLSTMSLVRANMQGINGRIIEKRYYDRILELLKLNGDQVEKLPQLSGSVIQEIDMQNEKDVEGLLLEPLLKKLGYKTNDWKRQLKLRMGRGDRVYPDYVIFPKEERNNESGYWIWEAKFEISNSKQLKEDFGQAKSYALRLKCKGLGLISKEGVWLSEPDFDFEKIKFWSWKQINESDHFNEIFDIAGNKKRN